MPFLRTYMELNEFVSTACKGRIAYEFRPKQGIKLDLNQVARRLEKAGIEIEIETPVLLLLRNEGKGITLSREGKLLIKGTKDREVALGAAEEVILAI